MKYLDAAIGEFLDETFKFRPDGRGPLGCSDIRRLGPDSGLVKDPLLRWRRVCELVSLL